MSTIATMVLPLLAIVLVATGAVSETRMAFVVALLVALRAWANSIAIGRKADQ